MLFEWACRTFGRARVLMALGCVAAACFCGLLVLFGVLLGSSTAQAYVGPRPTVEQVKIFSCNYRSSCAEDLENDVNRWLLVASGEVRIVGRKFIMADRGTYAVAIFYEKFVERPAGQKLPAEKP